MDKSFHWRRTLSHTQCPREMRRIKLEREMFEKEESTLGRDESIVLWRVDKGISPLIGDVG